MGAVSRQLLLSWSVTPWADPGKGRDAGDRSQFPSGYSAPCISPAGSNSESLAIIKGLGGQMHWEKTKVI